MSAKLLVNVIDGRVEAEGDEKFVFAVYEDLKSVLKDRLASGASEMPAEEASESSLDEPHTEEKRRRSVGKRGGPSCAARIAELNGFFSELRDSKAILAALAEKGHHYEGKHVAAALINMTKSGKLRRVQKDGNWMYQNP